MTVRTLLGRDHHALGEIAIDALDRAALAISLGGASKVYAHTDPNEDAALLVSGAGGLLVAVADGHGGADAAEIALGSLTPRAEQWTAGPRRELAWRDEAIAALLDANRTIREAAARGGRRLSRTTLAFALIREGDPWIRFASIGDSHVFHVTPEGALDLARAKEHDAGHPPSDGTYFLGFGDETEAGLADKAHVGSEPLPRTLAVVLATDGLSERGVGVDEPEDVVAMRTREATSAQGPPAIALARGVADAAVSEQRRRRSGDNVAVAAVWFGEHGD